MSVVSPVLSTEPEYQKVSVIKRAHKPSKDQLSHRYNLDQISDRIITSNHKRVALQFPDYLLPDSTIIAEALSAAISKRLITVGHSDEDYKVFILADSSYSPCCVDEVAAQHIHADVVVHFGNTCLNPVRSIPTIYVLDELKSVDVDQITEKFVAQYPDKTISIILMSDTQYCGIVNSLYKRIAPAYPNAVLTSLQLPSDGSVLLPKVEEFSNHSSSLLPKRNHPALAHELSSYSMFYLSDSSPSPSLVLHLSTLVSDLTIMDLQSMSITAPRSALQKRYRYMNEARAASTIGILVNTLSIRNVNEVFKRVQNWIVQSGKKHYTFVVGKPTVHKLANFDVVDVWVILGCSLGGIIVDCSDYYKPMITPYELNLALQREVMWSGQWLIDFEETLRASIDDDAKDDEVDEEDKDEPYFDPISGKYLSNSRPLRALQHVDVKADSQDDESESALATRASSQLAIRGTISTAVESLQSRTWTGLRVSEDNENQSSASELEQGRKGIARGYTVSDDHRT